MAREEPPADAAVPEEPPAPSGRGGPGPRGARPRRCRHHVGRRARRGRRLWEELNRYADRAAEGRTAELEEARRTAAIEMPGKSYIFKLVRGPLTLTPE